MSDRRQRPAPVAAGDMVTLTRHPRRWQPTAERFRDPRSGEVMRVWQDSAGGRHYVPES